MCKKNRYMQIHAETCDSVSLAGRCFLQTFIEHVFWQKRRALNLGKLGVLWGVGKREQAWSRSLGFMVKRPETRLGDNGAWAGRRLSGHQAPPKEKGFDKAV